MSGTISESHYAIVTNVTDPEKRGRLKVKCQSLVGADTELPQWAEPDASAFTSLGGAAMLFVPDVKSTVEITVDVTDIGIDERKGERFMLNPGLRWKHAPPTRQGSTMPLPKSLLTNYPQRRGFASKGDLMLIFDEKAQSVTLGIGESKATITVTRIKIKLDINGTIFDVIDGKIRVGGDDVDQKMIKGTLFWTKLNDLLTKLSGDLMSMQAAAQGPMSGLQPGLAAGIADINTMKALGASDGYLSHIGWLK
jgi:hypothetical protein